MTQSEYVKHSGLTKGRVSQLVSKGMPLDSAEAADAWRGSGAQRRKAAIEASHIRSEPIDGPYRPPEAEEKVDRSQVANDTPQGAYERQKQIERAAYNLASEALAARSLDAGRMVTVHATAAKNLISAREDVISLSEKERTLVSGSWVKKVMQDHDGAVASLLKSMPKQLAGRIAPHDPEHAERELDRWVQEVCLKTLHQTDPWKS
jgi:hypothetical protein